MLVKSNITSLSITLYSIEIKVETWIKESQQDIYKDTKESSWKAVSPKAITTNNINKIALTNWVSWKPERKLALCGLSPVSVSIVYQVLQASRCSGLCAQLYHYHWCWCRHHNHDLRSQIRKDDCNISSTRQQYLRVKPADKKF